jgi:adenylate kinase family enzyme
LSHQEYLTPETAAQTILTHLSPESRLIVTGQIGCGKTTLSRAICARLGLAHLEIDVYNDHPDAMRAAAEAARSIPGGWVAEANVWQIPQSVWEVADLAIYLDYPNLVHYWRIIGRCLRACVAKPTWANIRDQVSSEFEHLTIMVRYASANREGWRERGGIADSATPVIRCASSREADRLLGRIAPTGRTKGP